ncbi:MAG: NAD(P)-dependent glycerol-3-phosphate dehydrogenase [Myxococcaceae bacterium]|nr:NAD(P)-dependent glycerol-3-phosphate dehydrogenase [Myxococcaceae bacterium]
MKATVIGSGSFGTACGTALCINCDEVMLWGREPQTTQAINERHENPRYLPGIPLPEKMRATTNLEEALRGTGLVLVALPSHATREVMKRACDFIPPRTPVCTVAKGIENDTLLTMTEVLESCLPEDYHPYLAILSGPSFAKEMVRRMPTVVTVASNWERIATKVQRALQTDTFRVYTSKDVVGVQYGGALKNVIAIAAGIADGMGLGHNARAALITRGLAEITRAAVRAGANPLTLSGLSGMGDLVLTCTSDLSRNRTVGFQLGQGKTLQEILGGMTQVAEGVRTAKSARDLSKKLGVEMPICDQVYAITHEGKDPRKAVVELMTRSPKPELL